MPFPGPQPGGGSGGSFTPADGSITTAMLAAAAVTTAKLAESLSLTTPALGVATATSINKVAITAPATSATLTLADGSTLATSGAYSITLTATGATNVTLPTSGTLKTTTSSYGWMLYYGSPGKGSTNTNIMRWTNADAGNAGGSDLSIVQSASNGDYFLVGTTGTYQVTGSIQHSSGALHVYVFCSSGALVNTQNATETDIKGSAVNPGPYSHPFGAVFKATAGDKIYISCAGTINNTYSKHNIVSVARVD